MITLDLTPTEEVQISTLAQQIGLTPSEYVTKLVRDHLQNLYKDNADIISRFVPAALWSNIKL